MGQGFNVTKKCSFANDFMRHQNETKSWFLNSICPKTLVDMEVTTFKFLNTYRDKRTKINRIPVVITYHPLFKDFVRVINSHLHLLDMNEVKKPLNPCPMVSFRGARKLSSYLVRVKLYTLERSVTSSECKNKRCQVCMNVTESNTFSSSVEKKEYVINHSFNYNDKCIIYLLTCSKCKLQYLSKAVDDFCLQWNNYKHSNRKHLSTEAYIQQYLFVHFSTESHSGFLEDIPIIFINKTDSKDPNAKNIGDIP